MLKFRTVRAFPDETMSSWLIRSSLYQGCDTLTLASTVWGKYRIWTTDFERYLPPHLLEPLSQATGVDVENLDKMLLIHNARLHSNEFNQNNGIWPWVMCQGLRNRKKSMGQPFCPICLSEDSAYLKKEWRMAWATTCTKHQILLQDKCAECGFLFHPAKLSGFEKSLSICHHCGNDVGHNPVCTSASLVQAIIQKNGHLGLMYLNKPVDMATWLATLRGFISLIRKAAARPNSHLAKMIYELGINKDSLIAPQTAGTFEWLPIHERNGLLQNAFVLIQHNTEDLISAALNHSVTANTIQNALEKNVPETFQLFITQLEPCNKVLSKRDTQPKPLSEEAVMKKWARLQRKINRIMSS